MDEKAGSGGGGEVRKIHIVYFISRKGQVEHPHLIRVHHLSRTGVHLRDVTDDEDVKRWLSELRGKDMPESFAWSYKRRYKAGYVWQDLLDEDLITPISDNEYVLKGSEISSMITLTNDLSPYSEKDDSKTKATPPTLIQVDIKDSKTTLAKEAKDHSTPSSAKTSFEVEELPSFGSETSNDDTSRQEDYNQFVGTTKHEETQKEKKTELSSLLETYLSKNKNDSNNDKIKKCVNQKERNGSKASRSLNYSFEKSSSYSGSGAAHMFLNLITCGIVDTNDSAVTVIKRKDGAASMMKREKFGGSERASRGHWTALEKKRDHNRKEGSKMSHNVSDSNNKKTIRTGYRFVNGPYCSQCGRQFNPEKLHTHMKSCRRMKAMTKAAKSLSEKLQDVNQKDQPQIHFSEQLT